MKSYERSLRFIGDNGIGQLEVLDDGNMQHVLADHLFIYVYMHIHYTDLDLVFGMANAGGK